MSDLNIKSETIDKVVDKLAEPLYEDVAKPAISTSKGVLSFCSKFIVSGIKPYMYSKIKECEYKIKEIDQKLEEKYNKIPDENKTEPRTNILGPAVDVLKYNLEEEHIKDMFINLISKDLDKTQQPKVLPYYVEIIKQLSSKDAKFLKLLNDNNGSVCSIMLRVKIPDDHSGIDLDKFIIYGYKKQGQHTIYSSLLLDEIVIDNLQRQQLIEVKYDAWYTKRTDEYECLFNAQKDYYSIENLTYKKGFVRFTSLGKNFTSICLS